MYVKTDTECVMDLDQRSEMIVFKSLLTNFEVSVIFRGSWGHQWKSAQALNQKTITNFNQFKLVQIRDTHVEFSHTIKHFFFKALLNFAKTIPLIKN